MLGLSPPRIFQCRNVKALDRADRPWEILSFLSAPSLRRGGSFKPPKPLATARVRAAQHSRVASAPRRITGATTAVLKPCPTDPAEPFAITFAPPREWLRVKDHVPPGRISLRGLQSAFKHSDQQTIYGLDEQPNVLWLAQKCVYASFTCHGFRERA